MRRRRVPGTSAGSTSPIRRQPFSKSHVRGSATSQRRCASAYLPNRGGDRPLQPMSELALAHVEGSRTVAAYARDDLLERRRPVMQAWCEFVCAAGG